MPKKTPPKKPTPSPDTRTDWPRPIGRTGEKLDLTLTEKICHRIENLEERMRVEEMRQTEPTKNLRQGVRDLYEWKKTIDAKLSELNRKPKPQSVEVRVRETSDDLEYFHNVLALLHRLNKELDPYIDPMDHLLDKTIEQTQEKIASKQHDHAQDLLNARERDILEMRFGKGQCTLEKIGRKYDITRARVRDIITEAIAKTLTKL